MYKQPHSLWPSVFVGPPEQYLHSNNHTLWEAVTAIARKASSIQWEACHWILQDSKNTKKKRKKEKNFYSAVHQFIFLSCSAIVKTENFNQA